MQDVYHDVKAGSLVLSPFFGGDIPGKTRNLYKSYTLSEVLSIPVIQKSLAGKYVFVGESGTMIHDSFLSPVSGKIMDGVESHAHFLDGILQKRYLHSWSITDTYFFLGIVGFILLMVSIYLLCPNYLSLGTSFIVGIWVVWSARALYFQYGVVVDIGVLLMAGSVVSFPLTYIYRFFIVEREKRLLTSAFSRYVDGRVVDKISRDGHAIQLSGESRRLSILFSDIAGFTTLTEKMNPSDLFYLMSSYLSRMTDILTKEG